MLGEINLAIIQERKTLVAGGYKKHAPRLKEGVIRSRTLVAVGLEKKRLMGGD